jgi:UDPglucose 6-dehydrogenase
VKIAVIGTGYVGLVVGACLSETGNDVTCADVDQGKIDGLKQNVLPIYEPGLDSLVERNQQQGRLHFTTDVAGAVAKAEVCSLPLALLRTRMARRTSATFSTSRKSSGGT